MEEKQLIQSVCDILNISNDELLAMQPSIQSLHTFLSMSSDQQTKIKKRYERSQRLADIGPTESLGMLTSIYLSKQFTQDSLSATHTICLQGVPNKTEENPDILLYTELDHFLDLKRIKTHVKVNIEEEYFLVAKQEKKLFQTVANYMLSNPDKKLTGITDVPEIYKRLGTISGFFNIVALMTHVEKKYGFNLFLLANIQGFSNPATPINRFGINKIKDALSSCFFESSQKQFVRGAMLNQKEPILDHYGRLSLGLPILSGTGVVDLVEKVCQE